MTVLNPYPVSDRDRHELWQMLVEDDVEAFVAGDWQRVADDFAPEAFLGLDARGSANPHGWEVRFPSLEAYQDRWLARSSQLRARADPEQLRAALYGASTIRRIDVNGEAAIVHKELRGTIPGGDGDDVVLDWTTIYFCRRSRDRWRIFGFLGYLPRASAPAAGDGSKVRPTDAQQHLTAGPYSPVLVVQPGSLVVISGQAALDPSGSVVGETVEEQATVTLDNCRARLADAGCTFRDVFKTNVFLADIGDWERFNEVYRQVVPEPRPVRTTVGAQLLPGLLVEIEMWAVRS